MLELRNITKTYNPGTVSEICLFDRFNLIVSKGEFLSVVGSNGSGKTSLLNIICGSVPLDDGDILIGGASINRFREHQRYSKIGRVYQNPAMGTCPNLSLLENLSLADNKGRAYGLGRSINNNRVSYYREQLSSLGLGLENKLQDRVGSLSGGQRQAVALVMSTLTPVDFLILDEHTAALDPKTAETIMQLTDRIIRAKGLTAIMVTHNLRHAVQFGDRLIMMNDGRVVLEKAGIEKKGLAVDDVLKVFTEISIECGN